MSGQIWLGLFFILFFCGGVGGDGVNREGRMTRTTTLHDLCWWVLESYLSLTLPISSQTSEKAVFKSGETLCSREMRVVRKFCTLYLQLNGSALFLEVLRRTLVYHDKAEVGRKTEA